MKRQIDHIVFCVSDLKAAVDYFESLLGIRPIIGGSHQSKGTKNALLNLGNQSYLEILSIDEENVNFTGNRWMGIDSIDGPKITRWSLKSKNLEGDSRILNDYSSALSHISKGSRITSKGDLLSWKMILPASSPEVEIMPFMTDWSESKSHPTDSLTEGCFLEKISLYHPNPNNVEPVLSMLGIDIEIHEDPETRLEIVVKSPTGLHYIK